MSTTTLTGVDVSPWTVPAMVFAIDVAATSRAGRGADDAGSTPGGGGTGGNYAATAATVVTPGTTIVFAFPNGNDASWNSGAVFAGAGVDGSDATGGSTSADNCVGSTVFAGGSGGNGGAGGGGGGGGSASAGGDGAVGTAGGAADGGAGGAPRGGAGGNTGLNGVAGTAPGGGGGGAGLTGTGGLGGAPNIVLTYTAETIPQTPTITACTTNEDTQSTTGLVIAPLTGDTLTTYFKLTALPNTLHGILYLNDGVTAPAVNSFISVAAGALGLKFTPTAAYSGSASFTVKGSTDNVGTSLSAAAATASITVTEIAEEVTAPPYYLIGPAPRRITNIVITRSADDPSSVAFFKITNIAGGTLYLPDGTTQVTEGSYVSAANATTGLVLELSPGVNVASFTAAGATDGAGAGLGPGVTVPLDYPAWRSRSRGRWVRT